MLNANLTDYKMPTTMDVPRIECILIEKPSVNGPYGAKGVGEPPVHPAAGGDRQRHSRGLGRARALAADHRGEDRSTPGRAGRLMQVRVKMWGNLRRFAPDGLSETDVQVADDATIADLMAKMGAEHEVFAASVNGKAVALSTRLAPDDRVSLFDHITAARTSSGARPIAPRWTPIRMSCPRRSAHDRLPYVV